MQACKKKKKEKKCRKEDESKMYHFSYIETSIIKKKETSQNKIEKKRFISTEIKITKYTCILKH